MSGQVQKVLALKKAGAQGLLIGNCTDCSNTVMSCAPKLGLPVYHCTDGPLRAVNHRLVSKKNKRSIRRNADMSITKETLEKHLKAPAIFLLQKAERSGYQRR